MTLGSDSDEQGVLDEENSNCGAPVVRLKTSNPNVVGGETGSSCMCSVEKIQAGFYLIG